MRNERLCMRQRPEGRPCLPAPLIMDSSILACLLLIPYAKAPLGKRGAEHRKDDVMAAADPQPMKRLL